MKHVQGLVFRYIIITIAIISFGGCIMKRPNSFENRYPNPVIHFKAQTKIKGLSVWSVFDKSQQAEDPIRLTGWIVNKKGEKFYLSTEGIKEALESIQFNPTSEEEALEAAILNEAYHPYSNDYIVFLKKPFPELNLPSDIMQKIEVPKIEKTQGHYRVTYFSFYQSSHTFCFYADERYVYKYIVEVAKGLYNKESYSIWEIRK